MGLLRATFLHVKWSNFFNTYQNSAKLLGWSRHEWKIVCVKFHENWLKID